MTGAPLAVHLLVESIASSSMMASLVNAARMDDDGFVRHMLIQNIRVVEVIIALTLQSL